MRSSKRFIVAWWNSADKTRTHVEEKLQVLDARISQALLHEFEIPFLTVQVDGQRSPLFVLRIHL